MQELNNKRLFLVNLEDNDCSTVKDLLTTHNCEAICFHGCVNDAMIKALNFTDPVDMLVVNLEKKNIANSVASISRFSKHPLKKKISIIVIASDIDDVNLSMTNGADDYIMKHNIGSELFVTRLQRIVRYHQNYTAQQHSIESLEQQVIEQSESFWQTSQSLCQSQIHVMAKLGTIAAARDHLAGDHISLVGEFSKVLALNVGMSQNDANKIKYAAPLHDIGKVSIPDCILFKKGRLTPDEWEIMKTHCRAGYQILQAENILELQNLYGRAVSETSQNEYLKIASIIAYYHHESWDGSGYPDGLKGEHTPASARIVAIVDMFEALTSKRTYKDEYSDEKAIEILLKERGRKLDPEMTDIFIKKIGVIQKIREIYAQNKQHSPEAKSTLIEPKYLGEIELLRSAIKG